MIRKTYWAGLALVWVAAAGILPATVPIARGSDPHEIGGYNLVNLTYDLPRSLGVPVGFEGPY
jgi:hypothetical protein